MAEVRVTGGVSFRSSSRGSAPDGNAQLGGGVGIRLSPRAAVPPNHLLGPVTVLKYAVHDLDRWLAELVQIGIGPWWISRDQAPEEFVYRGKQSDTRFAWGLTWSGDVMHEIIQPLDDRPSPYRDFLNEGREGLHHGAFYPPDYEGAIAYLKRAGKAPILHGHSGEARFTYFEGIGSPPQPIELQYLPEDVKATHRVLMRASQNWNGAEPFRGPPRQWW